MHKGASGKIHVNIRRVAFSILFLLLLLFIYVSYIQVYQSNVLASHPLNRRNIEAMRKVEQGRIIDRNNINLAKSVLDTTGNFSRQYPLGAITSHIVGYSSTEYGNSGIESQYTSYLTGSGNPERKLGPITHLWDIKKGNDIVLTLDSNLQQVAYQALGNRRGSVVAISPHTGEILVMVSKPGFDPNHIDKEWKSISQSTESPLLNRSVQGLYPPGSIIKVMIAESALSGKSANFKTIFDCEGSLKLGSDYTLTENNLKAHGKVDLEEALAVSCNITFGKLALQLGRNNMAKTFDRYGFSKQVSEALNESYSRMPDFRNLSDGDLAQTGIGQGSLLVTPLRMAMLASCFANNGTMMKPYIVSKIIAPDGTIIEQYSPQDWISPVNSTIANEVRKMMIGVVDNGTGSAARIPGVSVAGKTGTAETPSGSPHAWFIGFAPADNPQIAIAVIVENGGYGGQTAAPIARMIFDKALH
ncbi:Penicillin-binding protein A [bioreactor metagenome]|uniref:Penicillin-binding protein A n=1 Tax=bioreactor metagenome TaxID=1076179 RepID=A0A644T0S9_9ZZZZ|nr:penicillin-binding transpeptidase domain-containing protein [Negativicutes bacterium]